MKKFTLAGFHTEGLGTLRLGTLRLGSPPQNFYVIIISTATIGYGTQYEDIAASMANLVTVNIWF